MDEPTSDSNHGLDTKDHFESESIDLQGGNNISCVNNELEQEEIEVNNTQLTIENSKEETEDFEMREEGSTETTFAKQEVSANERLDHRQSMGHRNDMKGLHHRDTRVQYLYSQI